MADLNKDFGRRLKQLIKNEGLTQQRFAIELGVTHPAIGNYCRGRVPDGDTLISIAKFFGVTVDYLLLGRSPWEKGVVVDGRRVREDDDRARLLRKYNDVDESTRQAIRAILDAATAEAERREETDKSPPRKKRTG